MRERFARATCPRRRHAHHACRAHHAHSIIARCILANTLALVREHRRVHLDKRLGVMRITDAVGDVASIER